MTKSIIRNIFLLHAQTLKAYKFIHSQYITKGGMININLEILEKHVKLSA